MGIAYVLAGLLALDTAIYLTIALLAHITRPPGRSPVDLCREYEEKRPWLAPLLGPLRRALAWISSWIARESERAWTPRKYTLAGLLFSVMSVLLWVLLVAVFYACEQLATTPREAEMAIEYVLVGLVALGIAIYLAIALLRPDKF